MENVSISEKLTKAVKDLQSTLKKYEPYYSFAKRLPYLEDIRCNTFREWIEIRLNMDIYNNIPELKIYEEMFQGELFEVKAIYGLNEAKCKFEEVLAEITSVPNSYIGDENYLEKLEEVKNLINGKSIKFNYSQKKTKIEIL